MFSLNFVLLSKIFFGHSIKIFQSDGGDEFLAIRNYLTDNGIQHRMSCSYTPKQNGFGERKHRHVVETGLSLLHCANMPMIFWSHAFETVVYLINLMPFSVSPDTSPYSKLFKHKLNYLSLRVFGCLCYPWLRPYSSHKLNFQSHKTYV